MRGQLVRGVFCTGWQGRLTVCCIQRIFSFPPWAPQVGSAIFDLGSESSWLGHDRPRCHSGAGSDVASLKGQGTSCSGSSASVLLRPDWEANLSQRHSCAWWAAADGWRQRLCGFLGILKNFFDLGIFYISKKKPVSMWPSKGRTSVEVEQGQLQHHCPCGHRCPASPWSPAPSAHKDEKHIRLFTLGGAW